ncbi:Glycosyl transferase family 2 [Corynebacterium mycetoides]|uniref:Glycosyl transferase family 2 n=1 Tax=Corynebacterium mycetoides TaxID=38302 RepID=A0A1G9NJ94_9CORY|nr:glycosyltransferase [Corynebacterium mycetoides]SDL86413.1 Glycosyl transferase family 2 [Corynebacterium mycetoides]
MTKLSVIIPCYNVSSKLTRCLNSLNDLKESLGEVEVIFIDDCSTDNTFEKLVDFAKTRDWVVVERLDGNSGTPSVPRNVALGLSKGEFVFHLDPDDEILPAGIQAALNVAVETGADFVRAPLIRDNGHERKVMNRIEKWQDLESDSERISAIVQNHSTTVCSVYRSSFLADHNLKWPEDLRLAEDAIFLYRALNVGKVEYSDEPDFVYHVALSQGVESSTQQYQDRELLNHLSAWATSSQLLSPLGIDYFALRGQAALSAAIQNMIRFNSGGFTRENFLRFSEFLKLHKDAVENFTYGPRFREICELVLTANYEEFLESIKIRLLIAGYDLRFIVPAIPELSDHYQIQVDEWNGHDTHDVAKSQRLLDWADAIHCEWMLGNAVWYSAKKNPRQSLTIRLHRFETSKNYGNQLTRENVDRIITIAPLMFEETQRVFGFDRSIVRYVPNYIDVDSYERSSDPSKVFNLVMVGSIPIRKGYRRALELLNGLVSIDPRYNLTVFGRRPEELGWVYNDPKERAYFSECEEYIQRNGLDDHISFQGWVDTKEALADKGFVLSMSDAEGSHVAAAEGFASGNITLLRPWEGADYMYPEEYVLSSLGEMRDYILECRDFRVFEQKRLAGDEYVNSRFSMKEFLRLYKMALPIPYSVP